MMPPHVQSRCLDGQGILFGPSYFALAEYNVVLEIPERPSYLSVKTTDPGLRF